MATELLSTDTARQQPVDAYHSGGNDEEQNGDQEVGPEAAVETTPTREAPRILFSAPAVVQCSGTDMQHTRALLHSHRETLHGAMDQLRRALLKYMEQQVAPEFTGIAEQTKSMATAVDRVEELSTAAMEAAHQARANANGTSATMRRFQRVAEARLLGIETRLREFESVVQRSTDANNALRGQVEELLNMLLTSGPGSPVTPLPGPLPSPRSMSPDPYGGSLEAQQEAVDSTIAEVDQKLGRVHQESSKRRAQHSALDE
jgi:predicted RNase H-like HicB family nuclease